MNGTKVNIPWKRNNYIMSTDGGYHPAVFFGIPIRSRLENFS
jgi:hypothetical protein